MPEPQRPLKVFLCHASADKPKVRELYRTLKRRGIQPWLDAENLIPGQNWEIEIPKALLSSDVIIICLSPNSVDKEGYVQKEIKFALDKALEMPDGRIFLIPAKLEECDLPFSLRQYQAVNLYEKEGYAKLMKALKLRASQLERKTVELPKEVEIVPEIKKVVEENKSVVSQQEEPDTKNSQPLRAPSSQNVGVGDANITGSGNVISIGGQEKPVPETPKSEKLQPKKVQSTRQPNMAITVALIGFAGTIIVALLASPLVEKWFSPAPVSTEMTTATITMTFQPVDPSKTIEPSEMSTETFIPSLTPSKVFTPTPPFRIGSTMTSKKDGMVMVYVPEGSFTMGTDIGYAQEGPAHNVYLNAFWMDRTEVTDKQYALCVAAGNCGYPLWQGGFSPDYFSETAYADYPIRNVNWSQAKSYCEWAGKRLPTEAEWEKAARGTDGRIYPWGNEIPNCRLANTTSCVSLKDSPILNLSPAGSYPDGISPYGALDMIGNVWEWVADWYDANYYAQSPEKNPQGPSTGTQRLLRGGSTQQVAKAITRTWTSPDKPQAWPYGFRCVRDANP